MISDFKIPNKVFHVTEFWWIVGLTVILRLLQKNKPPFFHLPFLFLLNERGLAICHPRTSCLQSCWL